MSVITSSILVSVNAGHFNSIGTIGSGKYAVSALKKIDVDGTKIPFISPQAIRKYIRNYLEMKIGQPNYYDRLLRKTSKKDFTIVDPIEYFEDDYFGFSHPLYQNPNIDASLERLKVSSMNRRSPFLCNGLIGISDLVSISTSEGWVHPNIGSPLPYRAEFFNGFLQGSMSLELDRIGIFKNFGDIIEIDPSIYESHKTELIENNFLTFELKKREDRVKKAIKFYFDSIINLNGGAKSTMFADSLSPCIIITAKLSCSNNLPPNLFISNNNNKIDLNLDLLSEFIDNWKDYFESPLIIGYRTGTLNLDEEREFLSLNGKKINNVLIRITNLGKIKEFFGGS